MGPWTYFPNAVFAEVFVVTENDDFVGHGCTDAKPVLDLKSNWGTRRVSLVDILTHKKNRKRASV